MSEPKKIQDRLFAFIGVVLSVFVLLEVNYPFLAPQTQLAFFAMAGLLLIFLSRPPHPKLAGSVAATAINSSLIVLTLFCFGYVLIQSEPFFSEFWVDGQPLGNRAGIEKGTDFLVGYIGLILVLEATRRTIGLTLPILAGVFLLYAAFGPAMPNWLFPHRGYSWERIVSQTFLHSQGVFGIALKVMFTYVFLFVMFGALLERTGATGYVIRFARRLFRNSAGGPAKVAVISSGMMGSLSGSAVANTATTGTFTIPMMRSAGFSPRIAGGIEAAASSGGALVPPIMGAGAYMMLEIVEPAVTYVEIISAALIPAMLYYIALLLIVHFHSRKIGAEAENQAAEVDSEKLSPMQGLVFFGAFLVLILLLLMGYTPFRAVSISALAILVISIGHKDTRIGLGDIREALVKTAREGVALIAAASCVGIIIGVVTLTGIGTKLPSAILPLAQDNLLLALLLLMVSTIILGMGLPSAVCYLLMATLVGPVLGEMGLVPLAAHLFIFYFGMMSMVTPPVALAAYTAAAIAGSKIMQTGFAAFRFALVGFALPFAFVQRPELLLLAADGGSAEITSIVLSVFITLTGIIALAAGIAGFAFHKLLPWQRGAMLLLALFLLLAPATVGLWLQFIGIVIIALLLLLNWRSGITETPAG